MQALRMPRRRRLSKGCRSCAPLGSAGSSGMISDDGNGGALLAGSATILVAFLLKYGSSVLDTILDVDNYLRTSSARMTLFALGSSSDIWRCFTIYTHEGHSCDKGPAKA